MVKKSKPKEKPKNKVHFIFSIMVVIFVAFFIWGIISYSVAPKASAPPQEKISYETVCLEINNQRCAVTMEVADSDQKRIQGLSDRLSIGQDEGMLFVSEVTEEQCFWMRGMLFPLDIVWIDESKKIVKIDKNISPDTFPTQFCSEKPVKYVIELNASQASALGMNVGQTLAF